MFDKDNPNFKVVVTIGIYPEGVPVPDPTTLSDFEIAQVALDCTADALGVKQHGMTFAIPQHGERLTGVAAHALQIAGKALMDVARGDKTHISGEELHHYEHGVLTRVDKVAPKQKPH